MANRYDIEATITGDISARERVFTLLQNLRGCNAEYGDSDDNWVCAIFDPVPCEHSVFLDDVSNDDDELFLECHGVNTLGEEFFQQLVDITGLCAEVETQDEEGFEESYMCLPAMTGVNFGYKLRELKGTIKRLSLSGEQPASDVKSLGTSLQKDLATCTQLAHKVKESYKLLTLSDDPNRFSILQQITLTPEEIALFNFIVTEMT